LISAEIGNIRGGRGWRQEAQLRAGRFDRRVHRWLLMDREIVEHDDRAGAQRGHGTCST